MSNKLIATIGCLATSCALYGQWLPPVNLPINTHLCDASSWKLIFNEDFNGNTINTTKWNTYSSYDGMSQAANGVMTYGDHENWGEARLMAPYNTILKSSNVVVSNGTCKLLLKNDPNCTWTYPGGSTVTKNLSGAIIATPYLLTPNGAHNYFNTGKFEARIKLPLNDGAWCNFWLWNGAGVNEIDIAEARSGDDAWISGFTGNRSHVTYSGHAFAPDPNNNPYNLPGECNFTEHYKRQYWFNYLSFTQFKMGDWHTYTCEWDSTSIKIYLDGNLDKTIWKYSIKRQVRKNRFINIGSGCNTNGEYNITYGYPYNSNSQSQLRFNAGFKESAWANTLGDTYTLGQMEIDYVKIWQKHPELDGHTELCAANTYPSAPSINGPDNLCAQGTYTLSSSIAGGIWQYSNELSYVSATANNITLANTVGGNYQGGYVSYSYGNGVENCPNKLAYKRVSCFNGTGVHVSQVTALNNKGNGKFYFITDVYDKRDVLTNTTPIIRWDISINKGQGSYSPGIAQNYTLYGQYVSSPELTLGNSELYNLKWTMTVIDGTGNNIVQEGERNSKSKLFKQVGYPNTYYLNAFIDDMDYYDHTVYNDVDRQMISEEEATDTLFVNELIECSQASMLEPYLIKEGVQPMSQKMLPETVSMESRTKVYPNPICTDLTIIAGSKFADGQTISINIYDLIGKLIKTTALSYQKGNIMQLNIEGLPNANYILELKQGKINEHIKIVKGQE